MQARVELAKETNAATEDLDFAGFSRLIREREPDREHTTRSLRERFRQHDVDGSGVLEAGERLRFELRMALANSSNQVKHVFERWDEDGSGCVSRREFRRAVRGMGFTLPDWDVSDAQIDEIFREFDTDDSGSISLAELDRKLRKIAGVVVEQVRCVCASRACTCAHEIGATSPGCRARLHDAIF